MRIGAGIPNTDPRPPQKHQHLQAHQRGDAFGDLPDLLPGVAARILGIGLEFVERSIGDRLNAAVA
jgi:hypothetical protein